MPNGNFITDSAAFTFSSANVIDSLFPSYSSILLDSVLNTSSALSLVNGVNDAAPMTEDGTPTYLSQYAQVGYANGINTGQAIAGDVTVAVIATLEAASTSFLCGSWSGDAGAGVNQNKGDGIVFVSGSTSMRMYMGTANAAVSTSGMTASRARVIVGRIAGTVPKIDIWNDAGSKVSATGTGTRSASTLTYRLGGRNAAWAGVSKVAEVAIWNSALSDSEIDAIRTLWAAKYGDSFGAAL